MSRFFWSLPTKYTCVNTIEKLGLWRFVEIHFMKLRRCELYDKTELESKFKFGSRKLKPHRAITRVAVRLSAIFGRTTQDFRKNCFERAWTPNTLVFLFLVQNAQIFSQ